jgi:hypothetical protein
VGQYPGRKPLGFLYGDHLTGKMLFVTLTIHFVSNCIIKVIPANLLEQSPLPFLATYSIHLWIANSLALKMPVRWEST